MLKCATAAYRSRPFRPTYRSSLSWATPSEPESETSVKSLLLSTMINTQIGVLARQRAAVSAVPLHVSEPLPEQTLQQQQRETLETQLQDRSGDEMEVQASPLAQPNAPPYTGEFHPPLPPPHKRALRTNSYQQSDAELKNLMSLKKTLQVMHAFRTYQRSDEGVSPYTARNLLKYLARKDPMFCMELLQHYLQRTDTDEYKAGPGDINQYKSLITAACDSVRYFHVTQHNEKRAMQVVNELRRLIVQLEWELQATSCCQLLSAVVEQKFHTLGVVFGPQLYDYILAQKFDVNPGFYIHLLSQSKFAHQDYIPYPEILQKCVESGLSLDPGVVLNAVENMYPFANPYIVKPVLQSLLTYQRRVVESGGELVQIYVDMSVLERIATSAVLAKDRDILYMVWDMLDVLKYKASESIFESTVHLFSKDRYTYREAFTALYDMERNGMVPSKALIRSTAVQMRPHPNLIDHACHTIQELESEGNPPTVASLNMVICASGERGDIHRALNILHEFGRLQLIPSADSFSYAFESLGKNARSYRHFSGELPSPKRIDSYMSAAESLLTKMEELKVEPTAEVIQQYVSFLCEVGQVDTATSVVMEAKDQPDKVTSKTIYTVALANAKSQKMAAAWKLSQLLDSSTPSSQMLVFNLQREQQMLGGIGGTSRGQPKDNGSNVRTEEERDSVQDHVQQSLNAIVQDGFQNRLGDFEDDGVGRRDEFGEEFH